MVWCQPLAHTEYEKVEPHVADVTLEEIKPEILSLKNWKALGTDDIPAEFVKYVGEKLHEVIFKICQQIWGKEQMPGTLNEAIIIPLYK